MIDPDLIVNDPDHVKEQLARKKVPAALVTDARSAIIARRQLVTSLGTARAGRKTAPREQQAARKQQVTSLEQDLRDAEARERELLLRIPNLPDEDAPDCSAVRRSEGDDREDRPYRPHWEIAADLGFLDPARSAKLSGSGFALLRGDGARLLHALESWGLDLHGKTYAEVIPPHFVKSEVMTGTGHLPKFAEDAYHITPDDLWAIPTGEVPLTALHSGEIVGDLPKRYMALTSCFRREAGSAGKDTRGIQRVHEFRKLELVRLCTHDQLEQEYRDLLADCERTLRELGLPYRVVDLACDDLTFASSRVFDLEVYAPGARKWLEVSSVGRFTDFQGRRSGMRYRTEKGMRPVCTLNGSGVATPRLWAAILEHGEQPDRTVRIPDVLVPYAGKEFLGRA